MNSKNTYLKDIGLMKLYLPNEQVYLILYLYFIFLLYCWHDSMGVWGLFALVGWVFELPEILDKLKY